MSNLILPALQSAPNIGYAWPVKKTPKYRTIVQTPASNRGEARISLTPNPIYDFEYDLSYIKGDFQTLNSKFASLLGFYQAVHGAGDDWLFQDPFDNSLLAQLLGYGDGSRTQFQLGRTLGFGGFEILQNVFPTALYINAVTVPAGPQPSGNQWYCGLENWLFYSQDFTQSAWNKVNTIINGTSIAGPDGVNLTTIEVNQNVAANGFIYQNVAGMSNPGKTFTFSVWVKQGTLTGNIVLRMRDGNDVEIGNSTVTPTSSWVRYMLTATFSPFAAQGIHVYIDPANDAGTGTYYLWGAQLEEWASARSYVLTTNNAPQFPRGVATFSIAPGLQLPVTADFSYYYRCRFLDDEWTDLEEFLYQVWELKSLKFRSLIL